MSDTPECLPNVAEVTRRLQARTIRPSAQLPEPLPRVTCRDGFSVSIQASEFHYCYPRDNVGPWRSFELGKPSAAPGADIMAHAGYAPDPTGTVYIKVPAAAVEALLAEHGGVEPS